MFTSNFQFVSDSSYYLNIFKLVILIIIVILSITLFLITFKKTCKSFWSAICRKKTKKSSKIEEKLSLLGADLQDESMISEDQNDESIDEGTKYSIQ